MEINSNYVIEEYQKESMEHTHQMILMKAYVRQLEQEIEKLKEDNTEHEDEEATAE